MAATGFRRPTRHKRDMIASVERLRGQLRLSSSERAAGSWRAQIWRPRRAGNGKMALLAVRMKQKLGPIGEVLGWIFVLSLVLGPWIAWFIGEPYRRHVVREANFAVPAIDGPMLNRSLLTPNYPASLSDCLIQTDPLPAADTQRETKKAPGVPGLSRRTNANI